MEHLNAVERRMMPGSFASNIMGKRLPGAMPPPVAATPSSSSRCVVRLATASSTRDRCLRLHAVGKYLVCLLTLTYAAFLAGLRGIMVGSCTREPSFRRGSRQDGRSSSSSGMGTVRRQPRRKREG